MIPEIIVLPFHYHVKTKLLTDKQMEQKAKDVDGLWDSDKRTIYIRKSLTLEQQRYILTHEMIHAIADWQHEHIDIKE